jgi:hypothetical protein
VTLDWNEIQAFTALLISCWGVLGCAIGYQRFVGPYRLHFQGEDGKVFRNIGVLPQHYTASQPKRPRLGWDWNVIFRMLWLNRQRIAHLLERMTNHHKQVVYLFKNIRIVRQIPTEFEIGNNSGTKKRLQVWLIFRVVLFSAGAGIIFSSYLWGTGWTIGALGFDSQRGLGIFLLTRFQNGSGAHPTLHPVGTRSSFREGKASGAWSWPLTFF